jgi:tetratricopeptide (TPR) repeat protein
MRGIFTLLVRSLFIHPLVATAFLISGNALAQDIDYDPRRATELRDCDDPHHRGRVQQARDCYRKLLEDSRNVIVQAEAAWALGDTQRANALFREAANANERSTQPRVRWGRLFLHTHQHAEALELFQEALERSQTDVHAKLGMAHVLAEQFEGRARTLVDEVLKQDDQLIDAHLLKARMDLEEGQLENVDATLDRAQQLADRQKQPPLEIFTLRAVLEQLQQGKKRDDWIERALAYNPRYGSIYQQLAHFEVMRRRYSQATVLLRRAVEVQPDLWSAQAELGSNLLREGDFATARTHLTTAYSGDPYSATTVNTLRLLDRVDDFEVTATKITIPALAGGSTQAEVRTRLSKKEADAMRPYVQALASDSIATFSKRYGFEPREPITLELYPEHDDFAVRVAALPGIGLLGVTFGYLVAMDSPSGRPTGEFHWGSTLWHEMAHVFTLEATDHRVPRWLSEGISVFEEWRTGPTPGVVVTPETIAALNDKRLLPIADLDSGFIRPKYPNQVQVSYMQAGMICLFIEQKFGFEQLVALLKQFTKETTTKAAVEDTFKMPSEEFDKQFDAFARERYKGLLADLSGWEMQHQIATKAVAESRWRDAIEPARKAVELYPEHSGPDSPYLLLARALDKSGDRPQALQTLLDYRKAGGWDPGALRELAKWLDEAKRADDALEVFSALNYVDPLNGDQHVVLGERLLAAARNEDALREFRVQLALSPHDRAPGHFGMARALRAIGDQPASRRHLLDALETAPHYKPAQDLLLQMIEERKRNE